MKQEEWKPISGFEGYEVSDAGRVRSWKIKGGKRKTPLVLKPSISHGHLSVLLSVDGIATCRSVALLVLGAFGGPRPDGTKTVHRDGNLQNNRADNLHWEPIQIRSSGTGREHLTTAQVLAIKERLNAGEGHQTIANDYPVTPSTIRAIHLGETWKNVGTLNRTFVPSRRHVSQEQRAHIVSQIKAGRSTKDVAEDVTCDYTSVARIFHKDTGISVSQWMKDHPRSTTPDQRAWLVHAIKSGQTLDAVGAQMNFTAQTIASIFAKETGLTVRQYRKTVKAS